MLCSDVTVGSGLDGFGPGLGLLRCGELGELAGLRFVCTIVHILSNAGRSNQLVSAPFLEVPARQAIRLERFKLALIQLLVADSRQSQADVDVSSEPVSDDAFEIGVRGVEGRKEPYWRGFFFVELVAPGMKSAPLSEVQRARASEMAADPEVKALGPKAPAKGEARNPKGANQHAKKNNEDTVRTAPNPNQESRGSGKAEYLIRRLKRDAPAVAAELARGEHPSARAAAIKLST